MYCILIAGAPASGKSTFASYLSSKTGIACVSKDDIKEKLFDHIGFRSRQEKVSLDICATEIMYLFAGNVLKSGHHVILDNNFENSSKPSLFKLIEAYGADAVTIRFQGDMSVIYQRFISRDMSPDRHRGHVVNTSYPETEKTEYIPMGEDVFTERYTQRGMTDFSVGRLITADCTDPGTVDYDKLCDEILNVINKK